MVTGIFDEGDGLILWRLTLIIAILVMLFCFAGTDTKLTFRVEFSL
jgi:hypothetical protein